MKANRKAIVNDEEAVSPVIAVILMVAITVVLAATVFVLVNELGQDVGQTGPTLGLTTASGTGGDTWNVRVTSATQAAPLSEFTVILSTPAAAGGTMSAEWSAEDGNATFSDAGEDHCYELNTITGGNSLGVGERLQLTYDQGCTGTSGNLQSGAYELEFIHRPTGTSAGSISRTF
jgi:archaeal type IV pilus assembly protein PilA